MCSYSKHPQYHGRLQVQGSKHPVSLRLQPQHQASSRHHSGCQPRTILPIVEPDSLFWQLIPLAVFVESTPHGDKWCRFHVVPLHVLRTRNHAIWKRMSPQSAVAANSFRSLTGFAESSKRLYVGTENCRTLVSLHVSHAVVDDWEEH